MLGNLLPVRMAMEVKLLSEQAKILIVSSTSGHFTPNNLTAYCPSKWTLENMCSSLSSELKDSGISVEIICPRTIKNVSSTVFVTTSGISVFEVTKTILHAASHQKNTDHFIPSQY